MREQTLRERIEALPRYYEEGVYGLRGPTTVGQYVRLDDVLAALAVSGADPRTDERAFALAIIKRCAAYVRGFYPSPPAGFADPAWQTLQNIADMLEAQPNALISAVSWADPWPTGRVNTAEMFAHPLYELVCETVHQIEKIVDHQPHAQLCSNAVERIVLHAFQRVQAVSGADTVAAQRTKPEAP